MSKTITLNVSDENYKFLQEYAAINQQSVEDWICSLLFQSEDATCALPLEIRVRWQWLTTNCSQQKEMLNCLISLYRIYHVKNAIFILLTMFVDYYRCYFAI
jgi:hypothetical protein